MNIIAGRAVLVDGSCKVYDYDNREVTSAATRLDHFPSQQGAAPNQKITTVSGGAGEFEKAVDGSQRPLTRILDWFHIAMKFRTIEQSAQKFRDLAASNGRSVLDEIVSAKWLTWHGGGSEAVERLKSLHEKLGLALEEATYRALLVESAVNVLIPPIQCSIPGQLWGAPKNLRATSTILPPLL